MTASYKVLKPEKCHKEDKQRDLGYLNSDIKKARALPGLKTIDY
jgi:hypothetical protein